jgi:hypothetical protein
MSTHVTDNIDLVKINFVVYAMRIPKCFFIKFIKNTIGRWAR